MTPVSTTSTSYSQDVVLGGSYTYQVKACSSAGCSAWKNSNPIYAFSPATLTVPATDDDGSFTITWSGARQSSELFEYSNGVKTFLHSAGTSGSFNVTGKMPGSYTYYLDDCYQAPVANSSKTCAKTPDKEMSVLAPPAPASITTSLSSGVVAISWSAVTVATSYELQRDSLPLSFTSSGETTYLDSNVTAGATYVYRVRACVRTGFCSAWATASPVTVSTFPAPASITAVVEGTSIKLNWGAVASTAKYELERNANPLTSGLFTTYTDVNPPSNVSYTYRARACNASQVCSVWVNASPVMIMGAGVPFNEQYRYDALGRLIRVTVDGAVKTEYQYDKAGNRTMVAE
jgi:YD repeat-containing protein